MSKVRRDLSTEENREFWDGVDQAAAEVATWPVWKKAGITAQQHTEPVTYQEELEDVAFVAHLMDCENCGMNWRYHVKEKCLFAATTFKYTFKERLKHD